MRLITLLLFLAILGYAISIYLDGSTESSDIEENYYSRQQQVIDQAKDSANQLNQALQEQQRQLKEEE